MSVAVAFKRVICEHEVIDDDRACEEFLTALSAQGPQLADGDVDADDCSDADSACCECPECDECNESGVDAGGPIEIPVIGERPQQGRCRTVLIRRDVHISDRKPATRAWPFTVRVKVITCSSTTPTADCRDVVAHLQQNGLLRRRQTSSRKRYSTQ